MSSRSISDPMRQFWNSWVDRRGGIAKTHQLHHRNLYVLPTKLGWAFVVLALIVWLLGTNYQNNLILALSYLQLSIVVVVILRTYNNLSGLQIDCQKALHAHAGESVSFILRAASTDRSSCHSLQVSWLGGPLVEVDIGEGEPQSITVAVPVHHRGIFCAPRLKFQSRYPLGLVRCWTWLRFDMQALVYPALTSCSQPAHVNASADGSAKASTPVTDDFYGYRQYVAGQSLRHIDWKQYARERGLMSKLYGAEQLSSQQLHWQDFFSGDTEHALSCMAYWSVKLHQQGTAFGLSLPSDEIEIADGDEHLAEALRALATFEQA